MSFSRFGRGKKEERKFTQEDRKNFHLYHSTHYQHCYKHIPKKHKINRQIFINLTRFIMSKVEDGMVNEKDGVLLDNFGYFFVFMIPKPRYYYRGYEYKNTLGRTFYPMFRALGKDNPLVDFYIPYTSKVIRSRIRKNVNNNKLYTFSLKILQGKSVENAYEKYTNRLKTYKHARLQKM